MTVAAVTPIVTYNENGVTTSFPTSFQFQAASDVRVTRTDLDGVRTVAVLGTDYSVTGGSGQVGTIITNLAKPAGWKIELKRVTPRTQPTDYTTGDTFPAETHERALDRGIMIAQEIEEAEAAFRQTALRVPDGEDIPAFAARAQRLSRVPWFDPEGDPALMSSAALAEFLLDDLEELLPGSSSQGSPGGNVMAIGLFTGAAALTIPVGTDIVQTSGYSAKGKGHALYIQDDAVDAAYVAAYPRAAFISANGRGFRLSGEQQLNVRMFGAVADDTTDDLPAFNAARDYSRKLSLRTSGDFRGGPSIFIPHGAYYLSSTWNIHHTVHIFGSGSGIPTSVGAILRIGNNAHGIVFHEWRTTDADGGGAGSAGLGDAAGSILEDIDIWGGGAASVSGPYNQIDSPVGHGIRIRCVGVTIRNVLIAFFGQDGINITATSGTTGATQGNANNFLLDNIWVLYCRRYGYLINGSDANAGTTKNLNAIACAAGGLMDYSFLGNTHIQGHMRDCGVWNNSPGEDVPTSTCVHGGVYYYIVAGQAVAASTTEPGTNAAVWRPFGGHPSCKPWVTGLTWVEGSPYGTNPANVNARNVFLGCYAESAQAPVQATYPSLFVGGLLDEVGVVGSATWMRGNASGGITAGSFISHSTTRDIQFGSLDGLQAEYFQAGSPVGDYRRLITENGTKMIWQALNSTTVEQMGLRGNTSGWGDQFRWFARLFIGGVSGNPTIGLHLSTAGSLADILANLAGQTVQQGWTWFYGNPVRGGPQGAVCVTTGTVGTTAAFEEFGYIELAASATYDPGSLAPGAKTAVQTVTVTGAAVGDFVQASFSNSLAGVRLEAWVSASNTVSYYFINEGPVPLTASEAFDPASLAAGAKTAIETVTVAGAALGDFVKASFSNSLAGAELVAWVSAADTVSYFIVNTNGADPLDLASGTIAVEVSKPHNTGPIDLASGTVRVRVIKP